jgi:hypothetical protein
MAHWRKLLDRHGEKGTVVKLATILAEFIGSGYRFRLMRSIRFITARLWKAIACRAVALRIEPPHRILLSHGRAESKEDILALGRVNARSWGQVT